MGYDSLAHCIADLERHGHLIRISTEVDPHLEMAAIHLRVHAVGGPAILFERVKGSRYPAVSNLYGTIDRSRFMFRDTLDALKMLVELKGDPMRAFADLRRLMGLPFHGINALPWRRSVGSLSSFQRIRISDLPQVHHWPMDGGPFVTLPQVLSSDPDRPGIMHTNLGMYRIQLGGNEYLQDEEVGLHYQLHRGIGVHQTRATERGEPFKVSIFVGGPPSHAFAAVMPLPEGLPEVSFAGVLGNRRFRYAEQNGHIYSLDADFIITGEVQPGANRPEGPFGDHLGYYSLKHPFPVMRVKEVLARRGAIWPFTVVGRPPQEDTSFGHLIHEITGPIVPKTIPGLREVHAVDAAGVHPLLLAIGSERYTPYAKARQPQEVLTIANAVLGFNQMSLAKFLFIVSGNDAPDLHAHDIPAFLRHLLERIDLSRDLHFQTNTTIDTLDYSGEGLNAGSKVVMAAVGDPIRNLGTTVPMGLALPDGFADPRVALPGILTVKGPRHAGQAEAEAEMQRLSDALQKWSAAERNCWPWLVVCDDSPFTSATLNNLVWVTFTRCNPSHDLHGTPGTVRHKHWGTPAPLIFDARIKPHHAPQLDMPLEVMRKVDDLAKVGGPLHGIL